jgi:hypothetical protein
MPWNSMEFHGIFHEIFHGIFHGISWNSMEFHGKFHEVMERFSPGSFTKKYYRLLVCCKPTPFNFVLCSPGHCGMCSLWLKEHCLLSIFRMLRKYNTWFSLI